MERGDAEHFLAVDELSLDGSVHAVFGVLPIALTAKEAGKTAIIVPRENAPEAPVVEGLEVYPADSLADTAVNRGSDIDVNNGRITAMLYEDFAGCIIATALAVHTTLGDGFQEVISQREDVGFMAQLVY